MTPLGSLPYYVRLQYLSFTSSNKASHTARVMINFSRPKFVFRIILRDSIIFPNPEVFDPIAWVREQKKRRERRVGLGEEVCCASIKKIISDSSNRACPGRQLAEASLFIIVASLAAVFDIKPAKDASGQEVPVRDEFTSGFVRFVVCLYYENRCLIAPYILGKWTSWKGQDE